MKIVPWTVAAFLSSSPEARRGHVANSSSSSRRYLSPLPAPVTTIVSPTTGTGSNYHTLHQQQQQEWLLTSSSPSKTSNAFSTSLRDFLVPPAFADNAKPPTDDEIKLLQQAMAAFYGKDIVGTDRDFVLAEELLTKALIAWQRQPADERAALYRVRGDCYMGLMQPKDAAKDYTTAIDLLEGPGGDVADPAELPAARLGRARAIRSQAKGGVSISREQAEQAAKDYQVSLRLSSREDWDTDRENEEDGASRNPYAAWEWGNAMRAAGDYNGAAEAHALASFAFGEIGDRARSIISSIDTGIDLAASGDRSKVEEAKSVLNQAIQKTTKVEGRDVALLQRVIAKEGEGRIALASVLWENASDRANAEAQLGDACIRLEQLESDAQTRVDSKETATSPSSNNDRLKFSIDDGPGAFEISCSRFKNDKFLTETLEWPLSLQQKVKKLENLGK